MNTTIKILHLEDDQVDAELVHANLKEARLDCRITIARTRDEFETALHDGGMDIILADDNLSMYNGISALRQAQKICPDVPFIIVSGTMGEEAAIAALTQGATDYVLKQNLSRLASAVQRALQDAKNLRERRKAEEPIRKLSQAIEQSPVSILITDVEGKIEFVNDKFTQLTGYTSSEAIGRNPSILKSGETRTDEYRRLWKTISSGGGWRGEFHNRKKSGELFWEQATIFPIKNAGNVITHYAAVKEDISDRKKLEEQLRQVQKMEAIGQLAGGIAHDFNNILSAITGYTELSMSILDPETRVFEYLAQVMEASRRAKELIHQILMFSRETVQELRPIRVGFPVKEALKLIRASVPTTIEIHSKIVSKAFALTDPTQIHHSMYGIRCRHE